MKDLHKCDACGAYRDPDSQACAGCEQEAASRREHAMKLRENDQIIGGQDERDYVTG